MPRDIRTRAIRKIPATNTTTDSLKKTTRLRVERSRKVEKTNRSTVKKAKSGKSQPVIEADIPYGHLIFSGGSVSKEERLKHIMKCYAGVKYINRLINLTKEQKLRNTLELPTANKGQKTLFLDLDETLIHSSVEEERRLENSVRFMCDDGQERQVTFTMRPYCLQFLESIAQHFEIYIYTASFRYYARAIMNFMNKDKPTITGYLCRDDCIRTSLGLYIKDLVRVVNRYPHQMLIVDNLVHSFGQQVDNGIPILEYYGNREDRELLYLYKYLLECAKYTDVREYNRTCLKLSNIVNYLSNYFEGSDQQF